jgi:hypothetical protein
MRKVDSILCFLLPSLATLLSGCAFHRDEFARFRAASTVCIVSEFDIHGFDDSISVRTIQREYAVRTQAGPPHLPFEEISSTLLEYAGLRVLEEGAEDCDLVWEVKAQGRALMREYSPGTFKTGISADERPDSYAGNRVFTVPGGLFIQGTVSLEVPGIAPHQKRFRGELHPPADMALEITHSPFSARPLFLEYDKPSGREACDRPGSFTQRSVEVLGQTFGVPFLLAAIRSQRDPVDTYAEKLLSSTEARSADQALLIAALEGDVDRHIRRLAAKGLGQTTGGQAVPALTAALKDDAWQVRQMAAQGLAGMGNRRAVAPLIGALKDPEWRVRKAAAEGLVTMGGKRVVAPLIDALKDREWRIRLLAAGNLGEMGDKRAVEPLIDTLKDGEFGVRYHAVLALERLGDPRAVGPLVAVLDDEEIHLQKRVLAALKTLTGRDDNDPDSWRTWWKQKEKRD